MTTPNNIHGPSSELEAVQSVNRLNRERITVNVQWQAGSFADFERRLERRQPEHQPTK